MASKKETKKKTAKKEKKVTTPEETPEEVTEETPEEVTEETPEEVTEKTPEEVTEETPEEVTEEAPEEVTEEAPEETPEEVQAKEAKALKAERAKIQAVKYENTSDGEAEIIVIHKKANRLTLPYKDPKGKGGMRMCILNPGKNLVGISVWKAVKEMAGEEDWAHFSRHFNVKEVEGSERGDVSSLETSEFLDIIENTFSLPELENYLNLENNKPEGKPRKGILTAIKKQVKEVKETAADLEKKKKKK